MIISSRDFKQFEFFILFNYNTSRFTIHIVYHFDSDAMMHDHVNPLHWLLF